MLLNLTLPRIDDLMQYAEITAVHARCGERLALGAKLMGLKVDLSEVVMHDCPPVSHYLITMRDTAVLRRLDAAVGDRLAAGAALALFSDTPDAPLDVAPDRQARISVIGVVHEPTDWGLDED